MLFRSTLAHLLQSALKLTLGTHIAQAGSYVCDEYTRFDFTHFEKVQPEQLHAIETWINEQIFAAYPVTTTIMDIESAKQSGATALFSEKYDQSVRVVSIGEVSKELCGGTHVSNTSMLGLAKVISEESIGSGVRRVFIKTSVAALEEYQNLEKSLLNIGSMVGVVNANQIEQKVMQILQQLNEKQTLIQQYEHKMLREYATKVSQLKFEVKNLACVVHVVDSSITSSLKGLSDLLGHQHHIDIVALIEKTEQKLS